MFHKAVDLTFLEGTTFEVQFQDGNVKEYDISLLFSKYPQLAALKDRELFLSGKLMGAYGIVWNDDLDLETETVYEDGITVHTMEKSAYQELANSIAAARAKAGLSQKQVAAIAGIDQSDFSKIERGIGNPSISTLNRIAKALGGSLNISVSI